jgi:hypothetical protein
MKHINLRAQQQFNGGFTDLFILGTTRNAGATDFTAAALTQSFNLLALNKGDQIIYPLAAAWVKRSFTDAAGGGAPVTLANLKLDVGTTDLATQMIAGTNGDLIQTLSPVPDSNGYPIAALGPAATSGGPYRTTATSGKFITATLTSTAGNMSTITFGEVWIYVCLARFADWMRDRDA